MNIFNILKKIKPITNKPKDQTKEEYFNYLINTKDLNSFAYEKKYQYQEQTLLKLYGLAQKLEKHIKIIVITDTHNSLNEEKFKQFTNQHHEYDLCLLLGDFSSNDLKIILNYIDKTKIYALLGNHDYNYIKEYNLNNLNGQVIEISGIKILGIEGSFRYKPVPFPSFSQKESILFLNNKEKVDILVSHDSPFNNNKEHNPAHQGLFGITYYLFKNKVPYHIHGHIHEPYENLLIKSQ